METFIQDAAIGLVVVLTAIGSFVSLKRKGTQHTTSAADEWKALYDVKKAEADTLQQQYDALNAKYTKLLQAASESWNIPKAMVEYRVTNGNGDSRQK